ncbi:MAG: class B sortase [Clostridia bacterium]|nr:class B sortase [Clostridia bacterium]
MKGKHYNDNKKKKKRKTKNIIIPTLLLIFISIMIFTGIKIFNWLKENKDSNDIIEDIQDSISIDDNTDTVDKYNVDFDSLKQKNSDTISWLKVNGTSIEYPVVKTTNNDFYMTHSFDKSYNSAGWVFMDYKNKFDGTDNNMVIYAHNRRDGSLFGTLKNILTEEWQNNEENFIIPFITENEKAEYQVFSVYKIEKEYYYITTNFGADNEFQKFIDTIKSRSIKDFNVDVSTEDHILTLSTCADNNKYRVVLHAKKITE